VTTNTDNTHLFDGNLIVRVLYKNFTIVISSGYYSHINLQHLTRALFCHNSHAIIRFNYINCTLS